MRIAARMADVTDKPESPDALLRMLLAYSGDSFEDRLRQELAKETFVGGRRVARQELPKLPKWAGNSVHVVKVNLYGAKPPVWRRLEIPSFTPLGLVHEILQVAFDWSGYHLHSFETVCGEYGDPLQDDWSDSSAGDESVVALAQVAATEKVKFVYVYDFGDDWRHDIVAEKIKPAEPGVAYPRCTGGRGETPTEDGGGIQAFNEGRAEGGPPGVAFSPADVTEALADLSIMVTMDPARRRNRLSNRMSVPLTRVAALVGHIKEDDSHVQQDEVEEAARCPEAEQYAAGRGWTEYSGFTARREDACGSPAGR
jgi:pRiA4b ORF-3-like protein